MQYNTLSDIWSAQIAEQAGDQERWMTPDGAIQAAVRCEEQCTLKPWLHVT